MKAQEKEEKNLLKWRFAVALYKAVKESGIKSFRQLAKEAGMEPAHIQKVSVGKLDVTLTTTIAIANALGISFTDLASYFDGVSKKDEEEFELYLAKQKKLRGKQKAVTKKSS
ncbi:helix-turn-helix transcriptional regulator [Danxiaibacter flavus]|uniref:Helix-turn-helix transcriptional regulator n=1 Tax=Danxiaibacter flavus TaxID=3049108 RepID=A0ABV3ZMG8_9BACT|nr:helix-turn-helix transcriptional regulator [Chitinophagaceae bacterium DXS]